MFFYKKDTENFFCWWPYLSVTGGVELSQKLAVDEGLDVVDHEEHDGLGDEVATSLGHDLQRQVRSGH